MKLHPGQVVWFMRGRRLDKHGIVVTGELIRSSVESRVQLCVTPLRAEASTAIPGGARTQGRRVRRVPATNTRTQSEAPEGSLHQRD